MQVRALLGAFKTAVELLSFIISAVERTKIQLLTAMNSAILDKLKRQIRLRGQAVKTSPFHGGNTGSIPVGVTKDIFRRRVLVPEEIDFYSSVFNILFGPLAQLVRAPGS